ncbi:hypothetical protein PCAR4_320012 [Paraburkholderia caribensis]|nr:hypothetical protein PCAR4_320012 [Paraburkholderia caribensis]
MRSRSRNASARRSKRRASACTRPARRASEPGTHPVKRNLAAPHAPLFAGHFPESNILCCQWNFEASEVRQYPWKYPQQRQAAGSAPEAAIEEPQGAEESRTQKTRPGVIKVRRHERCPNAGPPLEI